MSKKLGAKISLPRNRNSRRVGGRKRNRKQGGKGGGLARPSRRSDTTLVVQPWQALFPIRTVKRLRYNDTAVMTSTSGSVATYVLRANDLYDPDFSSTGHQPMGFDQMMVFYNHFTVTKAKLTATFENYALACDAHCVIRADGDSTAMTVPTRIMELGGLVEVICEYKQTSGSSKTATLEIDVAKFQGVSRSALTADPSLQGSSGASPVEIVYFHIEMWNNIALSGSVVVDFILEQEAYFTEPRDPTQS